MWKSCVSSELVELQHRHRAECVSPQAQTLSPDTGTSPKPGRAELPKARNCGCAAARSLRGRHREQPWAPEALRARDSSGLGTGFPGLEGCASQEVGVGAAGGWEALLPQPLAPPLVLAASSPEAFPNGTEVLGGLDSKDDAGDQEEGAPPQAEPEGVLGQRMWGQHAVLGALRHGSTPPASH